MMLWREKNEEGQKNDVEKEAVFLYVEPQLNRPVMLLGLILSNIILTWIL